ncbi:MAG TPA: hypothetical protein VFP33_01270 [Gallionella sp.]|nr:hypothetical protein [Gallionella sp.]
MNIHAQACNDAKLGIKAYQNLVGSLQGFDRFLSLIPTKDHILLSSVFCFAVVKYAKPFVDTKTSLGTTRYPMRHLKSEAGFDAALHNHLIELRNTLVAHDDLESIEPRILQMCMSVEPTGFNIPMAIGLSNKCLAYPIASESVVKLRTHVEASVQGVLNKVHLDLARVRDAALKYPEQAAQEQRYQKHYGQDRIEKDGSYLQPPNFMNDEWLNSNAPNFSHIHKGLLYEELRVRRDFCGPERIKLPDGSEVEISPHPHP